MDNNKPILLINAKNKEAAAYIISEIIDSKHDIGITEDELDCVWRIVNKYYSANIRVHAILDGEKSLRAQIAQHVEAHLVYLTNDECNMDSVVETMQRRALIGSAAHVRLVVADAAREPPALAAACARDRLELVALRQPGPPGDCGVARARAALHAHVWPGLVRTRLAESAASSSEEAEEAEEEEEEWSEWCSGPGGSGGFEAALGRLGAAAAAARGAGGSRAERLERAEQLVAEFCRALGAPLD